MSINANSITENRQRPKGHIKTETIRNISFENDVTRIGSGLLGTKVETLLRISQLIHKECSVATQEHIPVSIPHMHVIATDYFDQFMKQNRMYDLQFDMMTDREISAQFIKAVLPTQLVLYLYSMVEMYGVPLAVRASRLTARPYSYMNDGIIHAKMVPNNQTTLEERADALQNAVKLIYASSFFRGYRDHLSCVGQPLVEEKTAVIIQKVVGKQHGDLFYPAISGTTSSCNFFPQRQSSLYDGCASLILGFAKGNMPDVVKPWCYALTSPAASVPFTSAKHKLEATQNRFFSMDMRCTGNDPLDAFEYLTTNTLDMAQHDPTFKLIASTYDGQNDRFIPGTGHNGARVVDFAPLLVLKTHPLNETLKRTQKIIEEALYDKIAMEFAISTEPESGELQIHLLQVTPLFIHSMRVRIDDETLSDNATVIASKNALGNGVITPITDIVYVDPETFTTDMSHQAAAEVAEINRKLIIENRRYILIAMGRIGTTDPFRGLPVSWHQISGARVFIETDLPNISVDFSAGRHFFSDLVSCGSFYFYAPRTGMYPLDFNRLGAMNTVTSKTFVKHVRSYVPLKIMADGRTQQGVVTEDATTILM